MAFTRKGSSNVEIMQRWRRAASQQTDVKLSEQKTAVSWLNSSGVAESPSDKIPKTGGSNLKQEVQTD